MDETTTAIVEQWTRPERLSLVVPVPFPAVDAGLQEFLTNNPIVRMRIRRAQITTGSVDYIGTFSQVVGAQMATIGLRMAATEATRIKLTINSHIVPNVQLQKNILAGLAFKLWQFTEWLRDDYNEALKEAEAQREKEPETNIPQHILASLLGERASPQRLTGPSDETQARFAVFERLHREHPDWTQHEVATHAAEELEDYSLTAQTVKNTYRTMKAKWKEVKRKKV